MNAYKYAYYKEALSPDLTNNIIDYIEEDDREFQEELLTEYDADFTQLYICYDDDEFLGYMIVNKDAKLIYVIDTIKRGENIASKMINNFETQYDVVLQPYIIKDTAKWYWLKLGKTPHGII